MLFHLVGPILVEPAPLQAVENRVPNRIELLIELILQLVQLHVITVMGISSGQLLRSACAVRAATVGAVTTPLSHPATAVSPSWYPRECGIAMRTMLPSIVTVASRAVEPYTPLNAIARTPGVPGGSSTSAVAARIGTSHSSPVIFQ